MKGWSNFMSNSQGWFSAKFITVSSHWLYTAAWLAQLVERRTAVRYVGGQGFISPRLDQHSGS